MERQRQRARRRLGIATGEHCAFPNCVEDDPLALTGTRSDLLCYEHRAVRQGRSPVEDHHPATRAIEPDYTIPMPGNDHRVVTVMAKYWTDDVKKITSGEIQKDVARFSGFFDGMRQLVEKYQDTVRTLRLIIVWLSETYPTWEQDFRRWLTSRERREP